MKRALGAKTVLYPTPVLIVATYDQQGRPNAMTAAWGGICCSDPPSVAVSLRQATYSHQCILDRRAFTVNVPSRRHVKEADYFGMVSGRNVDKFAVTGLTAVASDEVDAPYIKEFPLVLECQLAHVFELGLHTQFIGQIVNVRAEESVLGAGGLVDIEKVQPFLFAPENGAYFGVGEFLGKAFSIGAP
jgi:flavin reductase (DIM6/NTAB) family NADH-FMN oxidoreductase RutF